MGSRGGLETGSTQTWTFLLLSPKLEIVIVSPHRGQAASASSFVIYRGCFAIGLPAVVLICVVTSSEAIFESGCARGSNVTGSTDLLPLPSI